MLSAPPLRLLLLFFAAVSGWEWVAVLALLEPYALLHPRMLPAALVRLAFLPMTALCAANAFFAHRLARSPLLRVRFPTGAQTPAACAVCGSRDSYLDEVVLDDSGERMFVCSDSHFCADRRAAGHAGPMAGHQLAALDKEPA